MIKFLLALFISTASFAATPGAVPSVTLSANGANTANVSITPAQLSGTCTTASSSPCFSLYGSYIGTATAGYFYVLYRNGVAYATPSTQKTYCFDMTGAADTGNRTLQLVTDQQAIPNNSNTTLTHSPTFQGGASGSYPMSVGPTANVPGVMPGTYVFGDGSHVTYVAFQVQANSSSYYIHMDCFEQ